MDNQNVSKLVLIKIFKLFSYWNKSIIEITYFLLNIHIKD